ncbi:MAG: filamentous hemagglutinin N-terminal domain-containing protein [Rhizonema sp. PD38]|nr:filamentous hemagglutinin N-terminal domain-containing protein [Rhizonema sp. PD38]
MSRVGTRLGWFLGASLCAVAFSGNSAVAQITPDKSLGTQVNGSLTAPCGGGVCAITNGSQRGGNLFHSFSQFSLPNSSDVADFQISPAIQNVIVRVTGVGTPFVSNINGTIQTSNPANFFLLNPNGIRFGPSARLNVGGTFLATTANRLDFKDGTQFTTTDPVPLLTITAPIGLGLTGASGNITMQSSYLLGGRTDNFSDFALVGGNISLDNTILLTPGGRVELGGLASSGTVGLNVVGNSLNLSFPDGVARADVSLTNKAIVSVAASGGGNIAVNARNLELSGGSELIAGIGQGLGSVGSQAGDVTLNATGEIKVIGGGVFNIVNQQAVGNGGNITINTHELLIQDGAQVFAGTSSAGKGGNLTVTADSVQVIGRSNDGQFFSSLSDQANPGATGNAGDLNIKTGSLLIQDGARVSDSTFGAGKAGNLTLNADNNVQVVGTSSDGKSISSLSDRVYSGATGNAGNLNIKTGSLLIRDGAQVSDSTFGAGKAGNLTLNADNVQVVGTSNDGKSISSLSDRVYSGAIGNAGDLNIETGSLLIRDGAQVSDSTFGAGNAGNLTVTADSSVQVIGTSSNGMFVSSLSDQANPGATGNAGDLNIKTGSLLIRDGAQVSNITFGAGKAGNLTVTADNVQVIGRSSDGMFGSILSAQAYPGATGNAGDLNIKTGSLLIRDGAQVSNGTFGAGRAGNLTLNADNVQVIGTSSDGKSVSNLSAGANSGAGNAGDLNIKTGSLLIRDGGQVSNGTFGAGRAGNLTVNADSVQVIGTSSDGIFGSILSDQANPGATGNAGDLNIKTGSLLIQNGALVSASTFSAGKAGNLTVNADSVQVIGTSSDGKSVSNLTSQAAPSATGNAGDLNIKTGSLLIQGGASVNASTFGAGKAGNLTVNADSVQVIGTSSNGKSISNLSSQAGLGVTGNAGDLNIKTGSLLIRDGGQVSNGTFGTGRAGNLTLNADSSVQVIGTSSNGKSVSSLLSQANLGTGNAGDLNIKTGSLLILDGARVSNSTFGAGKAGNLTVNADSVQVIGTSSDGKSISNLSSQAGLGAIGAAGDLTVNTRELLIRNGAGVSVRSSGKGNAGNLTVNARSIRLDNKATLSGDTQSINTNPNLEQATIILNSKDLILTGGSNITTNATGNNVIGGNINIDTDVLAALENSFISANSTDFRGGRVIINSQGIFRSPESTITATGAIPQFNGIVQINTSDINPAQELVPLSTNLINTNTLIANSCIARTKKQQGTFNITGPGGLPNRPGDASISSYPTGIVRNVHGNAVSSSWHKGDPIMEPQAIYKLPNGHLVLSRECS